MHAVAVAVIESAPPERERYRYERFMHKGSDDRCQKHTRESFHACWVQANDPSCALVGPVVNLIRECPPHPLPPPSFVLSISLFLRRRPQLRCQTYEGGFGGEPWNEVSISFIWSSYAVKTPIGWLASGKFVPVRVVVYARSVVPLFLHFE